VETSAEIRGPMGIEDYQRSAKYRRRLAADLLTLFPHLNEPDENALGRLTREALETAYAAQQRELRSRFGRNLRQLDSRIAQLQAAFQHLQAFLDERAAHVHRTGVDPLQPEADDAPDAYKSVFLRRQGHAEIVAVGGGKGGIGKSMVAANLAIALATQGRQVVAVDMDLGGADLHLSLGLRNLPRSLNDFIERKVEKIDDVRLTTAYRNLTLIATDSSRLGAANIKYAHKEKILRHLERLECDVVVIDLGAEVSFNVLDIFLAADHRYVITSTEPTSVLEAYGLIKLSLYRKIRHFAGEMVSPGSPLGQAFERFLFEKNNDDNGHPKNVWQLAELVGETDPTLRKKLLRMLYGYTVDLVVNMSESDRDMSIAGTMTRLCQDNLALNLNRSYRVPWDRDVRKSARKLLPVVVDSPDSPAARALFTLAAESAAARRTSAGEVSQQVGAMAAGAKLRVRKMSEMSALSSPGQPVNKLIPIQEEKETAAAKVRRLLAKEIHLTRG